MCPLEVKSVEYEKGKGKGHLGNANVDIEVAEV